MEEFPAWNGEVDCSNQSTQTISRELMMRLAVLLIAAGLGLLASNARADDQELARCQLEPATSLTKDCPVSLTQGQDYILRKYGDFGGGCVEMVTPAKTTFATLCEADSFSKGKEFRAGQTGTFWIRVRNTDPADEGPLAALFTDCKDANTTKCRLTLTGTGTGGHAGQNDYDRWKSPSLRKGRTYRLTFSSPNYIEIVIRNSSGQTIVQGNTTSGASKVLSFKVPTDAPVYIRTFKGSPYTLQLR